MIKSIKYKIQIQKIDLNFFECMHAVCKWLQVMRSFQFIFLDNELSLEFGC